MVRLHLGAMYGLAVQVMFTGARAPAEAGFDLLEQYVGNPTGEPLTWGKAR